MNLEDTGARTRDVSVIAFHKCAYHLYFLKLIILVSLSYFSKNILHPKSSKILTASTSDIIKV